MIELERSRSVAMSYETILFDVEGGVARLTLNRPDKLNSLNVHMHEEVRHALDGVPGSSARVLVLTGAGRGFCAGQDLADRAMAPGAQGVDLGDTIERYYNPLVLALHQLPLPVIGAVNGVAAGAGANIALACDLVIAARSANFVQAFCRLGLVPDSGGTWSLPRLVGNARALGLTLLGDKLSAEQAAAWGMIWQCVDDADFSATVDALALRLAAAPTRVSRRPRRRSAAAGNARSSEQLDVERDLQRELGRSADYAEGVAAFTGKRQPGFKGR